MAKKLSLGKDFAAEKRMLTSVGATGKPRTAKEAWGEEITAEDYKKQLDSLNKEDLQKICIASQELPRDDRNAMVKNLVTKFKKSQKIIL